MLPDARWRLLLALGVAGGGALALGFLPPDKVRAGLFVDHAFPLVALNLLVAAVAVVAVATRRVLQAGHRARTLLTGLIVALSCAALIALSRTLLPPAMRIQLDETQLLATSWGLWLDHTPVVVSSAYFDAAGHLTPLTVATDKRGLAHPILLWLVHVARGYRVDNALLVNAAFGWLALIGCFALARQLRLRLPAASAAVLLLAASPVFAAAIASAGFEPLNLALLAGVGALAIHAARTRDAASIIALLLSAPLLAQCRYESVIAAVAASITGCVLAADSGRRARVIAVLTPLWYLPLAWQRGTAINHDLQQIGADTAFSLHYLLANAWHLAQALRILDLNPLHFALPAASLLLLLPPRPRPPAGALWIAATLAAVTIVVLSYAWGDARRSETVRLILPLLLLFSLLAASGIQHAASAWRWAWGRSAARALPLIAGLVSLAIAAPRWRHDFVGARQVLGPALTASTDWLAQLAPPCRPLIISPFAAYYLTHGYSSIAPGQLAAERANIEQRLASGTLALVLHPVVGNARTGVPLETQQLPEPYTAKPLIVLTAGAASTLEIRLLSPDFPVAAGCTDALASAVADYRR